MLSCRNLLTFRDATLQILYPCAYRHKWFHFRAVLDAPIFLKSVWRVLQFYLYIFCILSFRDDQRDKCRCIVFAKHFNVTKGRRFVSTIYWYFFCQSSKLLEMRFMVIRCKFDEFSDHDFCYLQLSGWLQRVIFVKRRNRFEGGVLGSFSIDLIGFLTI